MIVDLLAVPQVSLLEARFLCESLGIRIGHLTSKPPFFHTYRPKIQSYFGPLRVVYVSGVDVFNQYADSLNRKTVHHLILLNAAPSVFKEVGIPMYGDGVNPLTKQTLLATLEKVPTDEFDSIEKKCDLAQDVMKRINKESMLGKLQTNFYRIKQVEDRHNIQSSVYAYLVGSIKRRPITDFPALDFLLKSDLCKKFIEAVSYAKKSGPDKASERFGIDRFEIAFVLKRGGYDVDERMA